MSFEDNHNHLEHGIRVTQAFAPLFFSLLIYLSSLLVS